jgi:F-type H+-transporting ATPase subunit alpha
MLLALCGGPVRAQESLEALLKDFQTKLQDFIVTRKDALLTKIREKGAINDELTADLKAALNEFKQSYKA